VSTLAQRLDALSAAADLTRAHLPEPIATEVDAIVERSRGRLRHGTRHTVVALAGPTGAGKSTLFNALVGEEVSQPGVRRPTTGKTHAAIFGGGADDLLDWLQVTRRHHVASADGRPELGGLVLLDLPDHDSTEESHRVEVDRLVELVDQFIWVVDPQKYADHALHEGYLRRLAGHRDVMRFVLSKADTLSPHAVDECVTDLGRLLEADGIPGATIHPVSASSSDGLVPLNEALVSEVAAQRSATQRIEADIADAVALFPSTGPTRGADAAVLSSSAMRSLVAGLARAAGADAAGSVARRQHVLDARSATGWPVTRWLGSFRKRPLADLPVARNSVVAEAEVSQSLREAGESAADGLGPPWVEAMRSTALGQKDTVLAEIDAQSGVVVRAARTRPRWWMLAGGLQKLALLVAAVGVLWLVALLVVDGLLRIDLDALTPQLDWVPLPTLLLLAGVGVGLLLALLARIPTAIGAARRERSVKLAVEKSMQDVAQVNVVTALDAVAKQRHHLAELLAEASSGP